MNSILKDLRELPMFKLSLGSKELFHSNFLEFLWEIDHNMFISIINKLLPKEKQLPENLDFTSYFIGREKEKFDICIYHLDDTNGKKTIIYDLIIENKVKSIPYKEQLERYYDKVKKTEGPQETRYILLSLANDFPDKSLITENANWIEAHGKWNAANYKSLFEAINSQKSKWESTNGSTYISDYCKLISLTDSLQEEILDNIESTPLFAHVEEYRNCRLADLYIKLRCSKFLILLKKRLEKKSLPAYYMEASENLRNNDKREKGIYLNQNIFRSVGQVAALIYNGKKDDVIFEIVIQGNEYRHGINSIKYRNKTTKQTKDQKELARNKLWNYCQNNKNLKEFLLEIPGDGDIYPQPSKKDKAQNIEEKFRGYNDDYVYKFKNICSVNVNDLLDRMVDDIEKTSRLYLQI